MFDNATLRALPGQLFYSTQMPVSSWFLAKSKARANRRAHRLETFL
jgi:type I restriction-modification system DNA methylase subunit